MLVRFGAVQYDSFRNLRLGPHRATLLLSQGLAAVQKPNHWMNTTHADYLAIKKFDSLDGLRAISILAVIWHHTAPDWVGATLAHAGAQGVSLFFSISGFLITTLLLREKARHSRIDLKAFYVRRSLRIFPLYYGVLLLYVALVTLLERDSVTGQAFYNNLIYFTTYTSNLFVPLDGRVIFYFAWSVAAEEQFYLIWPTVLILVGSLKRAALALIVVLLVCTWGEVQGNEFFSAVPLPIITGALLALLLHSEKGFNLLQPLLGRRWSSTVIGLGLTLAVLVPGVPNYVKALFFAAWVGACTIQVNHSARAWLVARPMAYIGTISYGMYMLHMLCKNVMVKTLGAIGQAAGGLEVFVLTVLLSTVVARLSFRYFESWFLELKTGFTR